MKEERWSTISAEAKDFVLKLLDVDPSKRLTAQQALEHPWIARSCTACPEDVSIEVVQALKKFGRTSKFRRCCMEMLAWSLTNEERAKVRRYFLSLDANHSGTITLGELRHVMIDKLQVADERETLQVFEALDYNHDQEIHYSDFLAAMVESQIVDLNEEHLTSTFRRFDADGSGFITLENLRKVLGSRVDGENVEAFMQDVDQNKDGRISFPEFAAYLREEELRKSPQIDAEAVAPEMTSKRSSKSKCSFKSAFSCFSQKVLIFL